MSLLKTILEQTEELKRLLEPEESKEPYYEDDKVIIH